MTEKHNITKSATAEERIEMDKSNILALDVETAANRPDYFKHRVFNDIISIGVVDTKTGDSWYWSVRPPERNTEQVILGGMDTICLGKLRRMRRP